MPVWAGGYEGVSSSMSPPLVMGRGPHWVPCASSELQFEEKNRWKIFGQGNPRYFEPHWPKDAVSRALQEGRAFKAVLRVNAYNRLEAYCTLDGVPVDILINGIATQNRSVEGDVVALILNPTSAWVRLKNSSAQLATSDSPVQSDTANSESSHNGNKISSEEQGFSEDPVADMESNESSKSLKRFSAMVSSFPSRRPTGRIIAIIEPSRRRKAVVGFLSIKKPNFDRKTVQLVPTDSKFPEMLIDTVTLPDYLKGKVLNDDAEIRKELLAARLIDWNESTLLPNAQVIHIFGKGGEIKPQIGAILFENAICCADFSSESLSCLPRLPWKIPEEEFSKRKDLRDLCTFTIDPSSAVDLDDALSLKKTSDEVYQIGVHIADASYFVRPDTALDTEAQVRSTSVYIIQLKLPMLPPLLSSELVSLLPHQDKLTVSIIWEINRSGTVLSRWIGRSIIRSCCKLSYEDAQRIIDGSDLTTSPVSAAVQTLHRISEKLKEKRLKSGALLMENAKIEVLFDENGNPYDFTTRQQVESNFLVREFMLLANKTVAEVISRAFPESSLLRRHPEPNLRKLNEFKAFCSKNGFEFDTSSSGHFHLSLEKVRERLKDDPILFEILISYALRPMQLASYFSTGDFREDEWGHYALGVPQYTHFTSPLRRYPDIVVHRMLIAALEAEDLCLKRGNGGVRAGFFENGEFRDFLVSAAEKYGVPCSKELSEIAAHCNERKLASRQAEEAGKKVYVWALLKKKEMLITEARVIRLGPKFMSIYIHKLAMERRVSYADVEGLEVEWLENTSTLILHFYTGRRPQRKPNPLREVALVKYPSESTGVDPEGEERENEILPLSLPLTLQPLSRIPVVLHAVGGEGKSPEIGVRLYLSSYFGV